MGSKRPNKEDFKSVRSPSPLQMLNIDMENSPVQIACTQESSDNIDVVWDWNSHQTKKQPRKCQKRLLVQSPKVPLKRHPSGNSVQDFEKLREELRSLKEELALPDHEESLRLSPIDEAEYKSFHMDPLGNQMQEDEFDELFDDKMNEQLFLFSQQVEKDLNLPAPQKTLSPKISFKKISPEKNALLNDSFDDIFRDANIKFNNDSPEKPSNNSVNSNHLIQISSGRVEFHRTQSFEMTHTGSLKSHPKVYTQEEIEKKRQEALAKLEAKKRLGNNISSSQCSPEEIEKKRLQALAKIDAKRQQEMIERKRQEALKRLQTRQKNATNVKSSLAPRLG